MEYRTTDDVRSFLITPDLPSEQFNAETNRPLHQRNVRSLRARSQSDEMILAEIDLRSSLSRTERSWKSTGTILSIDIASFLYMMVVDLTSERLRS
mmetsp:Transcript_33042/g.129796  ORF Transcript_33042/g.129796 Transcript_33042/m.129796 type:complete len:96 (-) Transcript_33042:741-1028(-)